MIVRLTGTVVDVFEESVVVERDGLGWEVLAPAFAIGELAACRGREVTLHTLEFLEGSSASGNLVPRLLGFPHADDKRFFQRFLGVKGIGPRKALKALAHPVRVVAGWIERGEARQLATLPGVGKRAAELILATLKGKMGEFATGGEEIPAAGRFTPPQRDALEVLVAWGDSRHEAERWLERAAQLFPDTAGPDEWVRAAYRVKSGAAG